MTKIQTIFTYILSLWNQCENCFKWIYNLCSKEKYEGICYQQLYCERDENCDQCVIGGYHLQISHMDHCGTIGSESYRISHVDDSTDDDSYGYDGNSIGSISTEPLITIHDHCDDSFSLDEFKIDMWL